MTRIKNGKYVLSCPHNGKHGMILFDTRKKVGRIIHLKSGWARDLVLPEDARQVRAVLEHGELITGT